MLPEEASFSPRLSFKIDDDLGELDLLFTCFSGLSVFFLNIKNNIKY
jgi:hypothetical protein